MKNLNYTIGEIFSNAHNKISNKVLDFVGTSISDRSFNSKEDVIFNCVNGVDWHNIVDFLSNNRKIGFSSDVRKEIDNNLKNK